MGRPGTERSLWRPVRQPCASRQIRTVRKRPSSRKPSSNWPAKSNSTCMTAVARRSTGGRRPYRVRPHFREPPMTSSQIRQAGWPATYPTFRPRSMTDGELDLGAFAATVRTPDRRRRSARFIVSETGGEASTLTTAEQDRLIRAAVEMAHEAASASSPARVPIRPSQAIELTQAGRSAPAPMPCCRWCRTTTSRCRPESHAHFRAIAVSTALPIILHDIPSRTMRELSDDTLLRLANSRQFIGFEGWDWRHHAAAAPAAAAAGRLSAVVRRRRHGAALYRQWRRRLHFHRSRTSHRNCARRSFRTAGRDGCRPRDICRAGWRR